MTDRRYYLIRSRTGESGDALQGMVEANRDNPLLFGGQAVPSVVLRSEPTLAMIETSQAVDWPQTPFDVVAGPLTDLEMLADPRWIAHENAVNRETNNA